MNIAVLGAGGFIGSHMVEHLIAHTGHQIVGLDQEDEKLQGITGPDFTFIKVDIRPNHGLLEEVIRGADVVVDLIAHANPSIYVSEPLEVFELNFIQNLDIARLCIKHGKRLIQYSSAEVYGKSQEGECYDEEATDAVFGPVIKQRWIYAESKLLLERVIHAHGVAGDLEYTIVRPFNFIGKRIDYLVPAYAVGGPRVFPHFMSALLTGGPIRLVDGGHAYRSFCHIEDATRAFMAILDQPEKARNRVFNVGNPANNLTIREVAALMMDLYEELTGRKPTSLVEEMSGEEFYGVGYEDGTRLPPSIERIRAMGWEPRHGLRKTFEEAMGYYLALPTSSIITDLESWGIPPESVLSKAT
jgi:UDP-apiose/xylose synthase